MRRDNVIPLFPRRDSAGARWRRRARAALALAGACAMALAPLSVAAEAAAGQLPPGHPPTGDGLPPGHPPVQGHGQPACTPGLPQGHPSVRDPRLPPGHPPVELKPCAPGASSNGLVEPDAFSQDLKVIET